MLLHHTLRYGVLAAAVAASAALPALAGPAFPKAVQQGQVSYMTGGIGEDEQQAMEASARDYNLLISNAEKDGEFTAGTDYFITDSHGRAILRAHNTGPLFYAQLPAGSYVIHATYDGIQKVKDISIGARAPTDIHLIWPQIDRS